MPLSASSPGGGSAGAGGPPRQAPLGILVAQVGKQLDRAFDEALARSGGTRPTWLILLAVMTGAGSSQSAIAERVGISGPTLIHHLDRLEAAGLVRREAVPGDRRGAYVAVTKEGAALLRRMWPVYRRGVAEHFAAHLDARAGPIRRMLERVAESAGP